MWCKPMVGSGRLVGSNSTSIDNYLGIMILDFMGHCISTMLPKSNPVTSPLLAFRREILNRSLLSSGGLMADVPCLDHSLDGCKGRPDDVQTTKHAQRAHAWSRCARTSLGAHASLFGASGARFWIVTRTTSARIEEPSMVSILYIKSSVPDTYK